MNIYLIASESYKQINNELNKILSDFSNVIKYDLRIDSLVDVINEANYFSLTGQRKYIIVKSNNLFKASKKQEKDENVSSDKDSKLLEKYLERPNELCTIIFTSYELPDKRKKIYKMIAEIGKTILIPTLNKKELTYKCIDILKEKGYKLNYETANFIVENSYVNYDILINELEKIEILVKPSELNITIIQNIISKSLTNNTYSFINSIITKNLKEACEASKNFEVLKIDPTMILVMLAKEFEIIYMLKSNVNTKELQKELRKEDWQMKNYFNYLGLYTLNELKKIIIRLNDYDYQVKSGLLDKSVMLDLLALEFCT